MNDREFLAEIVKRKIAAQDAWLKTHAEYLRADAECKLLRDTIQVLEGQLADLQFMERLKEEPAA